MAPAMNSSLSVIVVFPGIGVADDREGSPSLNFPAPALSQKPFYPSLAWHGSPRLFLFERRPILEQFDADSVRRANKGHSSISWWSQNGDASVLETLANGIDIRNGVRQMPKIPPSGIGLWLIPIPGQL